MECIFLGTGTALTSEKRHNTSLFIAHESKNADRDTSFTIDGKHGVLVDCNGACVQKLHAAGVDFTRIEHVFLTHHHIDHIGALGCFMQQIWLAACYGRDKGESRKEPLNFYGNPKTLESVKALFAALEIEEGHPDLFELVFHELTPEGGTLDVGGVRYEYFPNCHSVPCFGLRVGGAECKLVYSGDSEVYAPIYEGLTDGDVLIHECNALSGSHAKGHANWTELEAVMADMPSINLYLVHLPIMTDEAESAFTDTLEADYGGAVCLGTDGDSFSF